MGKALVIAEKPSVARDIAAALGKFGSEAGYFENDEYVVTWAVGHLVELAPPEEYDAAYRNWSLKVLPIVPRPFRLRVMDRTARQFRVIQRLLERGDLDVVVNACDAGREGELIFRNIYEVAGCRKPVRRLWISSLMPEAIQAGFASLRDGEEFNRLAAAARCRTESDWLVGINATRGLTKKFGSLLSVGRVQTPTLALIVEREREIADFQARPYWEVFARFASPVGEYIGKWFDEEDRVWDKEAAEKIAREIAGKQGEVARAERKRLLQAPPLLFDLTELQRDMNKRYGMSASRTLAVAQKLYEENKLITYPRTDCRYLPRDMLRYAAGIMKALSIGPYREYAEFVGQGRRISRGTRVFDDSRVGDHYAIIPTPREPKLVVLTPDARKVYDAVVRRFMCVFYPPAVVETTDILTLVGPHKFSSSGRVVLEPGWRAVYGGVREEEQVRLPPVCQGMGVAVAGAEVAEKQTKPPPRFTEATLLTAMETAGRHLDEEELREVLKDEGLGTPATRAEIIERLIGVGYVVREKKTLFPTEKGMEMIKVMPVPDLKSAALTGKWEKRLRQIEVGCGTREEFMENVVVFTQAAVDELKKLKPGASGGRMKSVVGRCVLCGEDVVATARAFVCSGKSRGCRLVIWKVIAGKEISAAVAAALLEKRKTRVFRGFKSRAGRKFSAALVLDEAGAVRFFFPERKAKGTRRAR